VEILEDLERIPFRIQSVVLVFGVAHYYILPRIPSSPTYFLLLSTFLLLGTTRHTSLYYQ
jgi:hypothetical protein